MGAYPSKDLARAMRTCLIVDDSRVIRKVARRILEDLGFEIAEAADGMEALAWCRAAMPDAILLDWNMPVMNGIDFLRRLRSEIVIVGEGVKAHADLLQVVRAGGTLSLQLGLAERGQQQRSEDGNDGDDNQQLDQSEPASPSVWLVPVHAMEFL